MARNILSGIAKARCENSDSGMAYGMPHKITTVDRYQGQQNDYIILSLVRTNNVGHLRDVRRLIVAMSRSRLGLYIVARKNVFEGCYELSPVFNILNERGTDKLKIIPGETYPPSRLVSDAVQNSFTVNDVGHLSAIVTSLEGQVAASTSNNAASNSTSSTGTSSTTATSNGNVGDGNMTDEQPTE